MDKKYVLKRLGVSALVIYIVITLTFALIQFLPGGPEDYLAAQMVMSTGANTVNNVQVASELKGSILVQYITWMGWVLQGNLGQSVWYDAPVLKIIGDALPWTVFVMSFSMFGSYALGIGLGAIMAYNEGSRFDNAASSVATFLNSIPYYVAGVLFLFFLALQLHWFPKGGRVGPGVTPGFNPEFIISVFWHATLPIASFVFTRFGFRALQMRGNSIQILGSNYVRVADLRGLSERHIALRYVAPNAVLPMYTGLLIALGFVFGGSVVLETIFQYQGIGFYLYQALQIRDVPLMMGTFMLISIAVVVGLTFADLTYGLIDPRAGQDENENTQSTTDSLRNLWLFLVYTKNTWAGKLKDLVSGESSTADVTPDREMNTSTFNVTSDRELSRKERYKRAFDEYIASPTRIVLSDKRAVIGLGIILVYVFAAVLGTKILPAPKPNQAERMLVPLQDMQWPLGTDRKGQSLLSTVVYASNPILQMVLAGALIGAGMATIVGLIAGYMGGIVERLLTGVTDVLLAIPGLPLVMVLAVVFEPKNPFVVGALLVVNAWAGTARQVHSQVLAIKAESYIEASRAMLVPRWTILTKDILPNIMPFVFIKTVQMGRRVIFSAVALYFLGILPFTTSTYNWGVTMNKAYNGGALYSLDAIHWMLVPMFAIITLTYGMVLFSQGTDQMFNPQVRVRHAKTIEEEPEASESPQVTPGD